MATHAPITGAQTRATKFIANLLAPLPADVPQAADRSFLRELKTDAGTAWRRSMRTVTVAKARLDYLRALHLVDPTACEREAFATYVAEIDRQMAVPTIVMEGVTWKRKHLKVGACQATIERREALIAQDVARMEGC